MGGSSGKDDFIDFELVQVEDSAIHFNGLSYIYEPDGSLTIYLLMRSRQTGQVREEKFRLRRHPPS